MGWLDLNAIGKGRTQTSHQQDQRARFPGNITQTQKFLRIFGGAKGLFAFQWASSERPGKFSALVSHWKARSIAMKKRQHPWSSFMKSQEKRRLGHFNCLTLGYRDKTMGIRLWQWVESKALLHLQQPRQPMLGATLYLPVLKERQSFLGLKKYSCNTAIAQLFPDP